MSFRSLKRALALVLTLDLALSPLAANAFVAPPPAMPTRIELKADRYLREMLERREHLERGELPAFNEKDIDPWAIQGQYVNLYDRAGNIISQYFLGQDSLGRPRPNFTTLTPLIDATTGCLVFEGTTGADANGNNGYVVARLHVPKMCNLASVSNDRNVLTIVDREGHVHLANFEYITNRAFRSLVWFKRDAVIIPVQADYTTGVESTVLTIGARPIRPEDTAPDALLPDYREYDDPRFDQSSGPVFTAGDVSVKAGGRVVAVLSRQTSLNILKAEKERILALTILQTGTAADLQFLREYIQRAELKVDEFERRLKDDQTLKTEPAVADFLRHLGPAEIKEFRKQLVGFGRWAKTRHDRFDAKEWNETWNVMFERATKLNGDQPVSDAYVAKEWKQLLPKNFQTLEQQAALTRESTSSKIRRNAAEYARTAAGLAALAALCFYPQIVEHSDFLKQFALVNFTYRMWPDVLKDAAYRMPLISSTFLLAMTVYLPGTISLGAAYALKFLNSAAKGGGRVATKIRESTNFWVNQENWQRISTFGYVVGGLTIITPLIRLVEGLFQQKELLGALRLHQAPWRVVKPDSSVGRRMNLSEPQTVGLTTPSFYGMYRKLKSFNPFGGDLGADMWAQQRHEFKQRLQLEVKIEKDRVRDFSRFLALLAVAEQEGVDPVTIQRMLTSGQFDAAELKEKLLTESAIQDLDLAQEHLHRTLRKTSFAFAYAPIASQIDREEMQRAFLQARDVARRIKTADDTTKARQHRWLRYKRRGFYIYDKALNQGRDEAAFLKGRVASDEVWPNIRDGYFPDTWMVTLIPAFFNMPLLHTRADLKDPEQLAAKIGAFGNINPKHMQDRGFNDTMQLAVSPAIDGCTFEVEQAIAEENFTPRELVANQVSVMNAAGHPSLAYPDARGAGGRYEGFLHEQKLIEWTRERGFRMPALQQYLKSARANLDIAQQAHNHLNASFSTVWSFMAFQFVARMGLGDQALMPSVLGMTFIFAAAPIFYKWWWWFLKPANNYYKRDMFGATERFFEGLARLDDAKDRPAGEGRDTMQREGIADLSAIFLEFAPESVDPTFHPALGTTTLEEQAKYWRTLAHTNPPRILPNAAMARWAMRLGAVGSTLTAIPMLVMATSAKYQTFAKVAEWIGISALFQTTVINGLGRVSPIRNFVRDTYRRATGRKPAAKTKAEDCDQKLTG